MGFVEHKNPGMEIPEKMSHIRKNKPREMESGYSDLTGRLYRR